MPRHSPSRPNFFIRLLLKWAGVSYVPNNQRHSNTRHHRNTRTDRSPEAIKSGSGQEESSANNVAGESNPPTHHRRRKKSPRWRYRIRRFFRKFTGFFTWKHNSGSSITIKKLWTGFKKRIGFKPKRKPLPETLFYKTSRDGSYKIIKATPVTGTALEETALTRPVENANHSRRKHLRRKRKFSLNRLFRKVIALFSGGKSGQTRHSSRSQNLPTALPTETAAADSAPPLTSRRKVHRSFSLKLLTESWSHKGFLLKLLGSIALFMVAYVLIWLVNSVAVMLTASFYNIDAVLYYYEVMWPAGIATLSDTIATTAAVTGPLVSVVLAMLSFYFLKNKTKTGNNLRTFLFWLFFLSLAHSFGAFAAAAVTSLGYGEAKDWLTLHTLIFLLLSLISLAALGFMGWKYARFILETRPLRRHGSYIQLTLFNRMMLPYLIGTLILIVIKKPDAVPQHPYIYVYDCLILASGLFFAIPPHFNKKLKPAPQAFKSTSVKTQLIKTLSIILLSVCIVAIYRLGLTDGLYVYLKFAVNVIPY